MKRIRILAAALVSVALLAWAPGQAGATTASGDTSTRSSRAVPLAGVGVTTPPGRLRSDSVTPYDGMGGGSIGSAGLMGALLGMSAAAYAATYLSVIVGNVAIPFPRADSKTAKKTKNNWYGVYRIYDHSKHALWKVGITSDQSWRRPESQLPKCRKPGPAGWSAERCYWKRMTTTTGWYRARLIEAQEVVRYVKRWGHCPPGQYYSCM